MTHQIVVFAKAPVPGRVKTRLCPPCTPDQAAAVAAAAFEDTITAVTSVPSVRRTLVLAGRYSAPPRWLTVGQREGDLGDRLAAAFVDTAVADRATLLVGMDTPQLEGAVLGAALARLDAPAGPDAVLGPAVDGGWWALGLRRPAHAELLRGIATSTAETGAETLAALRGRGLTVEMLPRLRDVDTADDALAVAASCGPDSRFADAVARHVPGAVGVGR